MKKLLFLALCILTVQFASAEGEQKVKSKVTAATVFLNGAQVTRTANINISKGRSKIIFTGISNKLNKGSINVSSDGDFTIVSVMHQLNYLEANKSDAQIESLDKQAQDLNDKINVANQMLIVYNEEESLLAVNKNLKGSQNGLKISELQAAADFYRSRLTEIKMKKLDLSKEIYDYRKELVKIASQLRELNAKQQKSTSEITVEVNATKNVKSDFKISYLVSSAGWYPNYDLRVKSVNSPISMTYKANVFQLSGEDWSNVKLTLSSGNPYLRSTRPILQPWRLNYYANSYAYKKSERYQQRQNAAVPAPSGYTGALRGYITDAGTGEPLIGANVIIEGTRNGASTDIDGFYKINVPAGVSAQYIQVSYLGYNTSRIPINNSVTNAALSEDATQLEQVAISSERKKMSSVFKKKEKDSRKRKEAARARRPVTNPVKIQQSQKATTVEFQIELPYTIPSNGQQYTVDIKQENLPTEYEYYAAPKLDLSAYLTARVPNWEDYNLLDGEVNLYFEGTYLGKTVLNVKNVQDTLEISLGRDKDIVIERNKQKEFNRRQFIGSNQISTRTWDIIVRNKKKTDIKIVIQDQIPVASVKDIKVTLKEKSKATVEATTGILTWELDIKASKKEELLFKYEVKFPKSQRLNLE